MFIRLFLILCMLNIGLSSASAYRVQVDENRTTELGDRLQLRVVFQFKGDFPGNMFPFVGTSSDLGSGGETGTEISVTRSGAFQWNSTLVARYGRNSYVRISPSQKYPVIAQGWVFRPAYYSRVPSTVVIENGVWTPRQTETGTIYINVYPPGTDLDEVDPESKVKGRFNVPVVNDTLEEFDARLVVDDQVRESFKIKPRERSSKFYDLPGFDPLQYGEYRVELFDPVNGEWVTAYGDSYTIGGDGVDGTHNNAPIHIRGRNPDPLDKVPDPTGRDPDPSQGEIDGDTDSGGRTNTPKDGPKNIAKGGGTSGVPDVYDDVRAALNQAGDGDTSAPGVSAGFTVGDQPSYIQDGTALNVVEATADLAKDGLDRVKSGVGEFASSYKDKSLSLPSVPGGRRLSYSVSLPIFGVIEINLAPYAAVIERMRNLILLVLYVSFWFFTIKAVRSSIA